MSLEPNPLVLSPEYYYHTAPLTEAKRVNKTFRQYLPQLPQNAKILDAGCCDGVTTAELAKLFPTATIIGKDIDTESVERARRYQATLINTGQINILHEDAYKAEQVPFQYDAIFFMNNLLLSVDKMDSEALSKVISNQLLNLTNNGYLLISAGNNFVIFKKIYGKFVIQKKIVDYSLENRIRLEVEHSIEIIEEKIKRLV